MRRPTIPQLNATALTHMAEYNVQGHRKDGSDFTGYSGVFVVLKLPLDNVCILSRTRLLSPITVINNALARDAVSAVCVHAHYSPFKLGKTHSRIVRRGGSTTFSDRSNS